MLNLKADYILTFPKGEAEHYAPITCFDYSAGYQSAPKITTISARKAAEQVLAAHLQGYSVYSEEHDMHTRIYIASPEEMARARKVFEKEYLKDGK